MKKRFVLTVLCTVCLSFFGKAQDIITKTNGEEIQAKVTEISQSEILYKKFSNLSGPVYMIYVSDVAKIKYKNGTEDVFNNKNNYKGSQYTSEVIPKKSAITNFNTQNKNNTKTRKDEIKYYNKVISNNNYAKREKYIPFINDEDLLYKIASKYRFIDGRTAVSAINRIENEDLLYKIAIENKSVQELAAAKINDEYLLYKIADKSDDSFFPKIAARITNQKLLYQLVKDSKNENKCKWTIERISDPDILKQLIDSSSFVVTRISAIQKIDDQSFLFRQALACKDQKICDVLFNQLDEEMLKKLVNDSTCSYSTKINAINKITDQEFLYGLLYSFEKSNDTGLYSCAFNRITDQSLLIKIAQDDNSWDTRKKAFNKLDSVSLEKIASGKSKDEALTVAAKIILKQTNWDREFSNRSSEYLGKVIGAAALVESPHPQPTPSSIVSACHTYIRRGDKSRIPELRSLLLRYGDINLAEDYLNCGNNELYDAGCEWGRRNGYNIGTGYGSHRVQWGSGR